MILDLCTKDLGRVSAIGRKIFCYTAEQLYQSTEVELIFVED